MTIGLTIPGVETVHPREVIATACYPIIGPSQNPTRVWCPLAHYTAAINLPDGDLGEFEYQLEPYLKAVNRDYWEHRDGSGITTCGTFKPGYAVGYCFAVDWLGGAWELRGFDLLPAATGSPHNSYTLPILFLTDRYDGASDLMLATARAIWRESRRRSGRSDYLNRPKGHRELCNGCTACPGNALIAQRDAGLMDLDYEPSQEEPPMATLAAPIRVLDTRTKNQPLEPMIPRRVGVLPQPPEWAGAVRVNLTATQPAAPGWLSIDGGDTSKVNFPIDGTFANEISIPLKHDGSWFFEVTSNTSVHILADVCGFDSLI